MCVDGANDCGALRAADVGVSLSIEKASIAAHFTSNRPDISCLIKLFREGKASLVSSIQTFKYMMIYSLIQFISVTVLSIFNSYLSDNQFLVPDLFIIFPLAILIARTGAYHK
jgi:cation-transporting ATPase 13A2